MTDQLWLPYFERVDITAMGDEWPVWNVERWERNERGETRFTGEARVYRPVAPDREQRAAVALLNWYDTTHGNGFGHDHHCPNRRNDEAMGDPDACTCGWSAFLAAEVARSAG